eukprot:TRINITY_DN13000_c0_g2_i10.p1 TRINITY_DN13000_c0_g2~~TRINITY_DN13000_c0_g2_i10.p1  ORF type:complete len:209 (-),score=37.63 TRINITY_DN13000_c0_g2_i10:23-649(-)
MEFINWFNAIAANPSKFFSLHWLCNLSIFLNTSIVLLSMLLTFVFFRESYRSFKKGYGLFYIRGVVFFGMLYSCAALMVGIRFHVVFAVAGKAAWSDIVLPAKGISLLELFAHCILYYTSMLLVEVNGPLILLTIIFNCMLQIKGKALILYLVFVAMNILAAFKSVNAKSRKTFDEWLWLFIAGLCLPSLCYSFKIVRLILVLLHPYL